MNASPPPPPLGGLHKKLALVLLSDRSCPWPWSCLKVWWHGASQIGCLWTSHNFGLQKELFLLHGPKFSALKTQFLCVPNMDLPVVRSTARSDRKTKIWHDFGAA